MGIHSHILGSITFLAEQGGRVKPSYQIAKKEFLSDYGYNGYSIVAPVLTRNNKGKISGSGTLQVTALGITATQLTALEAYRDAATLISYYNRFYYYNVTVIDFQETTNNDSTFDVNITLDVTD